MRCNLQEELLEMSSRIKTMRCKLEAALKESKAPDSWDHIVNQIGMFSYTGLLKVQSNFSLLHSVWN